VGPGRGCSPEADAKHPMDVPSRDTRRPAERSSSGPPQCTAEPFPCRMNDGACRSERLQMSTNYREVR
jgi:hypothetical protein